MSGQNIEIPHSPVEYAQDLQKELVSEPFERRIQLVIEALHLLENCGFGNYVQDSGLLVDAQLSFWKPVQEFSSVHAVVVFGNIALEGYAPNFSYLSLGNVEDRPINSICLALSKVTLLPDGDTLMEQGEMHIPVLAVESVVQFA